MYAHDNYERQDFEIINDKMTKQMVNSRKFVRFRQFDEKLLELYEERGQRQTLVGLYPRILDWAETLQK